MKYAPLLAATLLFIAPVSAQSDQPTLDDLLNITPPDPHADVEPTAGEPSGHEASGTPQPGDKPLDLGVDDLLSPAGAADQFEQAVREMRDASLRLGGASGSPDAGLETQRVQEDILKKLDAVLAAAEQQQQKQNQTSSGSSAPQPGQPGEGSPRSADSGGQNAGKPTPGDAASKPGDNAEKGGKPGDEKSGPGEGKTNNPSDLASKGSATHPNPNQPLSELRTEWGNLPPRLRDQVTEGLAEPFSPVYQRVTEHYYRLLAGEQETPPE